MAQPEPESERLLTAGGRLTAMATESRSWTAGHRRSVTTTTLACLAGVAAAAVSGVVAGTGVEAATNTRTVLVLAAFVVVQFPVHRLLGIDVQEYGVKDYLYIAFMTFTLWFITLTVMYTAGVTV
jgi:hypothetical protein